MYHRLNDTKTGQQSEDPRNKGLITVSTFFGFSRYPASVKQPRKLQQFCMY